MYYLVSRKGGFDVTFTVIVGDYAYSGLKYYKKVAFVEKTIRPNKDKCPHEYRFYFNDWDILKESENIQELIEFAMLEVL